MPAMRQLHSVPYPMNTKKADLWSLCTQSASQNAASNPDSSPPGKCAQKERNKNSDGDTSNGRGHSQASKQQVSWLNYQNCEGKSSLDLVVEWLTTGENYELWRGGTKSKREVVL
ncbi:uncharacterized protein VP01_12420g1 [Puccinia sorghi]|uniref:Uncharacterized protein n=1 Tax=Puccinia sorghi TaxID=27349 RepID=A0A0L6VR36_9BASI|nr:uncharacterized protein VP01_12420g1 [Puccinia sorghi]